MKRSYPAALPFWAIPAAKFAKRSEGGSIGRAGTCNVLFAAWLVRPDGAGLQFNEALALSGGEDTDFFARAHRLGARMVFSKKAFVTEEIPSSKLTYASQVRTAYWHAASNVRVYKMRKGSLRTFGKFVPRIVMNYCAGLLQIALSPVALIANKRLFKHYALTGGKKIYAANGFMTSLLSRYPQPYQHIQGY